MNKTERIENRITEDQRQMIEEAVSIIKEKDTDKKLPGNYGISSFMVESAVNRAKRLVAQKSRE
jgi:uncharacterized protein (DUF1778 family)